MPRVRSYMCMTRSFSYKSWVIVAVIIIYIVVVAITTASVAKGSTC